MKICLIMFTTYKQIKQQIDGFFWKLLRPFVQTPSSTGLVPVPFLSIYTIKELSFTQENSFQSGTTSLLAKNSLYQRLKTELL